MSVKFLDSWDITSRPVSLLIFKKFKTLNTNMKQLLALITFSLALVAGAMAQEKGPIRVDVTHTITTADTAELSNVGSNVVGLQATYVETSGTSAGKFYIEGTIDGVAWVHIDSSKSLADVTTAQSVVVAVTTTAFRSYRCRNSNTSDAVGTFYFTALRRPDEY